MDPISRQLEEKWMPALVATWRRVRGRRGPPGELSPAEVKEVGAAVRRLSLGLTRERELAGARYMEDPRLLGAYLLFYWPVSYAQARRALEELGGAPRKVLDLGSGPAPMALAAADHGAAEVIAADRSAPALEMARAIAGQGGGALRTRRWDGLHGEGEAPDGTFDIVTIGHALNELWAGDEAASARRAQLLERLLGRVGPKGSLLVIEPALRETSRDLLEVRDRLVDAGYAVRTPCLYRGGCPALEKASDWCHAQRPWTPPRVVQQIAGAAGLRKEALKMTALAIAPRGEGWPEHGPERLFRIVSEPLPSKGRLRYVGCGPEGRVGLAMQERHESPATRPFRSLARGDVIAVAGTEEKGDGLALGPEGAVRIVARAGEPIPGP
ncbi:MAG TPA: small ribosomal subunit Rsm22 family protein [Vulgatibacter sp.]|nr:small ribosomal subunit Rsm22 family protein [Vulgatibacter sp.]